jgi:hypothetical protein
VKLAGVGRVALRALLREGDARADRDLYELAFWE